jgi:CBS-domain-containing membrane protein
MTATIQSSLKSDWGHPLAKNREEGEEKADGQRDIRLPASIGGTWRRRMGPKDELLLALFPTATVLVVLFIVQSLSRQRVLFTSLAASAFLIYLDPEHAANSVRTLVLAQLLAAVLGLLTYLFVGQEYLAGGLAMLGTIVLMILLDIVHPPAVATSLSFAFRTGEERNIVIFALAVLVTAILVGLQRVISWLLGRCRSH